MMHALCVPADSQQSLINQGKRSREENSTGVRTVMAYYGGRGDHRHGYGGGGLATPGYAPPVPYGMSQVNIDDGCGGGGRLPPPLPPQPTVKVYCRANPSYAMTAREGKVVLAPANPRDEYQHWVKDTRWGRSVKDEEGYPAFALVNKATGEAVKHSLGQSHPVRLLPYDDDPDFLDESVLWTESRDVGEGFRCVRMVNNIYLNFDALHGDKWHGGVRDGTDVVLWKWCEGDNQRWKIQPYY